MKTLFPARQGSGVSFSMHQNAGVTRSEWAKSASAPGP